MMKQAVAFLDAAHACRVFLGAVRDLSPQTKAALSEFTLAERLLLRYPFPVEDRELKIRQLEIKIQVRDKLMPHALPVTMRMIDFWEQCFLFVASLSVMDEDVREDVVKGFASGRTRAIESIQLDTLYLRTQLRELNGCDA